MSAGALWFVVSLVCGEIYLDQVMILVIRRLNQVNVKEMLSLSYEPKYLDQSFEGSIPPGPYLTNSNTDT